MNATDYTLLICPVCGEQADPGDREGGPYLWCSHQDEFPTIRAIEVPAEKAMDPAWRSATFGLARFRLTQERAEVQLDRASSIIWQREYDATPREERVEKYGHETVGMQNMMRVTRDDMNRQLFGSWDKVEIPAAVKPKARRS